MEKIVFIFLIADFLAPKSAHQRELQPALGSVNFSTRIPDCDSHSFALLDLFFSSDTSICSTKVFSSLQSSDHVVVSVSIDVPTNSNQDAPFHHIACDYCCADWDGLHDHFRDTPLEDIFKFSASAAASEFCE